MGTENENAKRSFWWVTGGLGLILLGAFILISLATFDAGDPPLPDFPANPGVKNACGRVGAYTAAYIRLALGWPVYGLGLWSMLAGAVLFRRSRDGALILTGTAILVVAGSFGAAILQAASTDYASLYMARPGLGGGVVGILIARSTFAAIGRTGAWLVIGLLTLAGFWLVFGVRMVEAATRLWSLRPAMPRLPKLALPAPVLLRAEPIDDSEVRRRKALTITLADPDQVIADLGEAQEEADPKVLTPDFSCADEAEPLAAAEGPARIIFSRGKPAAEEEAGSEAAEEAPFEPIVEVRKPAAKVDHIERAEAKKAKAVAEAAEEAAAPPAPVEEEEVAAAVADADAPLDADGGEGIEAGEAGPVDADVADDHIQDVPIEILEKQRKRIDKVESETEESEFVLPGFDLLDLPSDDFRADDEVEIREKAQVLERTVNEFNIKARVVRMQRGPVITMYELALAAGIKVSRVESLADDLAMALKAPNVRIVAPLPGKSTVGVEVPNTRREMVPLREVLQEKGNTISKMAIPMFLGRDAAGAGLVMDLAKAPHMLIAGQTGSGKSVAINCVIMSILMTRTPQEVQMLLIDPKSVELSDFREIPHLISPVVVDMKKAAAALEWACKKMDERYALLSRVGARSISVYNNMPVEKLKARLDPEGDADLTDVPLRIPHTVIIVDELGELMMVAAKEVENSIIRLSQKSRAVGIHLICATQRPSVDVLTGLIKANLPCRVAFQVSSKVDSRTILDRNGADKLLGRGDMLFLPPGTATMVRSQGAFVSDEEILRVVDYLRTQGSPNFISELRQFQNVEATNFANEDEFYVDAVRIVLANQRGSVSLLQRKLGIGYGRAARLVDMMAEQGIVGDYKGSQARECMLSLEEWEEQLAALEEDSKKGKKRAG